MWGSSLIHHLAFGFRHFGALRARLPSLTGITYRGQAFTEVGLLPFGVPLLLRVARLLFWAGTRRSTTDQFQKKHRNQKHNSREPFHVKLEHDDNRPYQRGKRPSEMVHGSAKPDHSTFVTSYSSNVCSRYLCSSALRRSRISFNASSFFKLT